MKINVDTINKIGSLAELNDLLNLIPSDVNTKGVSIKSMVLIEY